LALSAIFSIHVGRLAQAQHNLPDHQVLPGLLADELADGGITSPQTTVPESGQLGQTQERQLEKRVPPLVQSYIDRNSVVINAIRCSWGLVRNPQGIPVEAITAGHCVTSAAEGKINPIFRGANGQEYMVSNTPITLETGIDEANLQPSGNVQEFIVPSNNAGIDQALALLPGTTLQE
jgi:hypothetical protein